MFGWTIRPRQSDGTISTEYLEKMAAKGWILNGISLGYLFFQKDQPKKVRFSVDALGKQRRKVDEELNDDHIQDYIALCEESGWQLVDSDGTFYVFVTEDENIPFLQTDAAAYKDSVHHLKSIGLTGLFVAVAWIALLVFGDVFDEIHRFMLWEWSLDFIAAVGILFLYVLFSAGNSIWNLVREKQFLQKGLVPKASPNRVRAWVGWTLGQVMIGAVIWLSISVFFERNVWLFLLAWAGYMLFELLLAVLERILWNKGKQSRGQIRMWRNVIILVLVHSLSWNTIKAPISDTEVNDTWKTIVTAEDFGWSEEQEKASYRYEGSRWAEEYYYSDFKDMLWYDMYVSEIPWLVDSFCGEYKLEEEQAEVLEAADFGLDQLYYWPAQDSYRERYLFRIENGALMLHIRHELTDDEIEMIADRLIHWS